MARFPDADFCLGTILLIFTRGGHSSTICSDNMTNVVGANNEIKQIAPLWQVRIPRKTSSMGDRLEVQFSIGPAE